MSAARRGGKRGAIRVGQQGGGLEQSPFAAAQERDLLLLCPGQGALGLCAEAEEPLPLLTLAVMPLLLLPGGLMGAGVNVDAADLINSSCRMHPERDPLSRAVSR